MSPEFERPLLEAERRLEELRRAGAPGREIVEAEAKAARVRERIFGSLTAWQVVQLARHPRRPHSLDYIDRLVDGFFELHGDRRYADDPAVVAGFGRIDGRICLVVGLQKGRTAEESVHRNFGMARPEGYRKAVRLFRLAERFGRPIVTLIDTPGAYPGVGAEQRGQASAVAEALLAMASLEVPVVTVVTGEGGSGGALALGLANRVLMLQYAVYSVMSPEGCASIVFRDAHRAPEAAGVLGLTALDLLGLSVVDEVLPEPPGGAHRDPDAAARTVRDGVVRALAALEVQPDLRAARLARFRRIGVHAEGGAGQRRRDKSETKRRARLAVEAAKALAAGQPATAELVESRDATTPAPAPAPAPPARRRRVRARPGLPRLDAGPGGSPGLSADAVHHRGRKLSSQRSGRGRGGPGRRGAPGAVHDQLGGAPRGRGGARGQGAGLGAALLAGSGGAVGFRPRRAGTAGYGERRHVGRDVLGVRLPGPLGG